VELAVKIWGQRATPDIESDAPASGTPLGEPLGRGVRGPDDDFFCLRFGVWYPSYDCAVRTRFKTCGGCLDCDQGRFNLKRHAADLPGRRRAFSPF
jgi:hypothetical protein